jgi:hypothetical protein
MTAAAAASLLLTTRASAQTLTQPFGLQTHRAGSIEYMSGGVGEQERAAMRSMGGTYNLKIANTLPDGSYVSNVDMTIADSRGNPILNTTTQGPLFYATVPAGQYTVTARSNGQSVQRTVHVGAGAGSEVALSFNAPSAASAPMPVYSGARPVYTGTGANPRPTPEEKEGLVSLYNLDPNAGNARAQVNTYEVYPDGTTRAVVPGTVRPRPTEQTNGVTIHVEPIPEPGAVSPPPAIISPDGNL